MAVLGFGVKNTVIQPVDAALSAISKVTLDAVISEGTQYSVTVTDHPIEDGSSVSDHIRDEPDQIQIDGIVSRTPTIFGAIAAGAIPTPYRHEEAWQRLYGWLKAHTLVKVITSPRTWENMAIVSLSRSRSSEIGEALQVSIKLKEIVTVVSSEVEAPQRAKDTQKPPSDKGKETPQKVKEGTRNSFLSELLFRK